MIKELAEAIKIKEKITNITIIGFGSADLSRLTESLGYLTLYCGKNLKLLPTEINQFPNLSSLSIEFCSDLDFITTFKFISTLRNLRSLYIKRCSLTNVSSEIGRLINLTSLTFSNEDYSGLEDNKLETLPPEIGHLVNLKELTIANLSNTFKSLPVEIANLKDLTKVSFWGTSMPNNLALIPNIKELDLTDASYSKEVLKELLKTNPSLRLLTFRENYAPMELKELFPDLQINIEPQPIDGFY